MTEFRFPVQDRKDHLLEYRDVVEAGVSQGHIDQTEADIAHKVAGKLLVKGAQTCGQAADLLKSMTTAQHRELVDEARSSLGLESIREIEHYEARARASQRAALSRPRTRIELQPNGTYKEVDLRSEDDISPGVKVSGGLLPTPRQLREAKARAEAERKEKEERKEQEQREAEALTKVRENYQKDAVISICGRRVPVRNVTVR